jgi:hypothetical protein
MFGRELFLRPKGGSMEYLSVREAAAKWNLKPRRVQIMCAEGRIEGAVRIANIWAIPAAAARPADGRVRSGKYRKTCRTTTGAA